MWESLRTANYLYLVPTLATIFLSHFLRAFRWRYLLDPIRRVDTKSLLSSLLIGYAANVVTPAHLGEILRAYILSKKRALSMSAILATVVMERIIDVFSLLALMALALAIYPFPDWVVKSGTILFAVTCALFFILVILKKSKSFAMFSMALTHRVLPKGLAQRMDTFFGTIPFRYCPAHALARLHHGHFPVHCDLGLLWPCFLFLPSCIWVYSCIPISLVCQPHPFSDHLRCSDCTLLSRLYRPLPLSLPDHSGHVQRAGRSCPFLCYGCPRDHLPAGLTGWIGFSQLRRHERVQGFSQGKSA